MSDWAQNQPPPWGAVPPYGAAPAPSPTPTAGTMFGKRLFAALIDGSIVAATGWLPAVGFAALVGVVAPTRFTPGPCPVDNSYAVAVPGGCEAPGAWVSGLAGAVMLLMLVASYFFVICRPQGRTGQTYGMRSAGIKVVDATTFQPIGPGRSALRLVAKIASVIPCYVGFFWMFADARQQTFHDKIVRTVVVEETDVPSRAAPADPLAAPTEAERYVPLLQAFVSREIDAAEFERVFMLRWKADRDSGNSTGTVINKVMTATDCFYDDDEDDADDPFRIDAEQLRAEVAEALRHFTAG